MIYGLGIKYIVGQIKRILCEIHATYLDFYYK